ncbi:MAG: DUF692 family protein [Anaerolineae bacterium]|nr:DUF692 family protein [Anaerolineae bacterium]
MNFALNYSPQAADLLGAGLIDMDLFKCPDWPDLIEQARAWRPVYVHFPLVAGQHNVERVGLGRIAELRRETGTDFVNTHIAARYENLDDPENTEAAVEVMLQDVRPLVERFGAAHVIAENIPYPDIPDDKPRVVVEPAVIRQVIETSGCGLLLDLAHARLTAEHLQVDVCTYIEQLPVDRLRELHVTGIGLNREGLREDHLPMTDADWDLFDWALDRIGRGQWARPQVVACEYGGVGPMFDWRSEREVMAHDIPRMFTQVRSLR